LLDASFDDIDLPCQQVREWDLEFQLLKSMGGGGSSHISQFRTAHASLAQARFTVPLEQLGAPPPDCLTFVIQDSGMKRLWWRGHDVDASMVLVFPMGSELKCASGTDFNVHTLSYPDATIEKVAATIELDLAATRRQRDVFHAPPSLLEPIRARLAALRDERATVEHVDLLAILGALLPCWLRAANAAKGRPPDVRARSRALRMSLEAMESDELTEWTPAKLRALCAVSERTLQYAFRERFGLTPAAFLKARRLARVRTALRRAHPRETLVADVMGEHGFWHVGQFARDYRASFGELPSETLGALTPPSGRTRSSP
jgi:AraC-like DNA-binding protein